MSIGEFLTCTNPLRGFCVPLSRGDSQISKDFGISNATLHNWLKKADVEDWVRPGLTEADAQELRVLKKRNRVLEQEVEILKRAAAYFARELSPK